MEHDEWVIVKKQRITIWIPPLPPPNAPVQSISIARPMETKKAPASNVQKEHVVETQNGRNQSCYSLQGPNKMSKANNVLSLPASAETNLLATDSRAASRQSSGLVGNLFPQWRSTRVYRTTRPKRQFLVYQNKFLLAANAAYLGGNLENCSLERDENKLFGTMSFLNVSVMQNLKRRAMNLERELDRVGGFCNWLQLQGLEKFVQIFQGKKLGKVQLATLTMDKLKDMGIFAVGPRRKLIHSIDRVSQPYLLLD